MNYRRSNKIGYGIESVIQEEYGEFKMSNLKCIDMEKESKCLHFIGGAFVKGYLWTNALEWNGCYRVDTETGEAEFLGLFEFADAFADKLFNQILAYGRYVFYIPWFSDYLVRLDTETLDTRYWRLPDSITLEAAKFRVAHMYNGKIFMFPHCGDEICIFNIDTEEFECDKAWLETFLKYAKGNIKNKFIQGVQIDSVVWVANLASNFLMKYNLESYEYEFISFPESEKKILDIAIYKDNEFLVLTLPGNVWKYDASLNEEELVYRYEGKKEFPYRHIFSAEDELYLLPANENCIRVLREGKDRTILYPYN